MRQAFWSSADPQEFSLEARRLVASAAATGRVSGTDKGFVSWIELGWQLIQGDLAGPSADG